MVCYFAGRGCCYSQIVSFCGFNHWQLVDCLAVSSLDLAAGILGGRRFNAGGGAACFCVCCWQIGGFASANFGGFGGGATLATGVVCVLGQGGFRWIRPPEIVMALTVWWRYIQRWRRRHVLALAQSTGELSGGVVFSFGAEARDKGGKPGMDLRLDLGRE